MGLWFILRLAELPFAFALNSLIGSKHSTSIAFNWPHVRTYRSAETLPEAFICGSGGTLGASFLGFGRHGKVILSSHVVRIGWNRLTSRPSPFPLVSSLYSRMHWVSPFNTQMRHWLSWKVWNRCSIAGIHCKIRRFPASHLAPGPSCRPKVRDTYPERACEGANTAHNDGWVGS